MAETTIPYKPRPHQARAHLKLKRFNVLVCHRRWGKSMFALAECILRAYKRKRARCAYIAPYRMQVKLLVWDELKRLLQDTGAAFNESELRVDLPNGSRIQLFGADNPDALRGQGFDLAVLDEYSEMEPRAWTEILRPALADREGDAIFIFTPKGRNHAWRLYQMAEKDPDWYVMVQRASESGVLPAKELKAMAAAMSEEEYAQELECEFQAAIAGSVYGKTLRQMASEGRIIMDGLPRRQITTHAAIDLGIADPSAVWLIQVVRGAYLLLEYFEMADLGLRLLLENVRDRTGDDVRLILPHDAAQRDLSSGRQRIDIVEQMGFDYDIAARHKVEDGITGAREFLSYSLIDGIGCELGLRRLELYRYDVVQSRGTFTRMPRHDENSHAADALRYAAAVLDRHDAQAARKTAGPNSRVIQVRRSDNTTKRVILGRTK